MNHHRHSLIVRTGACCSVQGSTVRGALVDIGTMTEEEAIALFIKSAKINLPN